MIKIRISWLAISLAILMGLVIWRPLFQAGMPYTHDGENHLARFANYYLALKEGQIPPRFAPNLMNRYGYPVFNYNYPLANIWSVPLTIVNVNLEDTFKILTIIAMILGAVGVWFWLGNQYFSKTARSLALLAYWSAPYVLSAVFFRGSIGEVMVYGLLPWLLWWLGKLSRSPTRAVAILGGVLIALMMLAHNVTGLLGLGIVLIFATLEWGRNKEIWQKAMISFLIGLGLSLWFWLPAIMESSQVVLFNAGIQKEFLTHLVTIRQLATSPLTFGFSTADPVDGLSLGMGATVLFTLWASIILFITKVTLNLFQGPHGKSDNIVSVSSNKLRNSRHAKLSSRHSGLACPANGGDPESSNHGVSKKIMDKNITLILVTLLLIIALLFLQSTYSINIWSLIPFAQIIQFPWRLMLFVPILILPVLAWIWDQGWWTTRVLILFGLSIQIWVALSLQVVDRFHKTNLDYFAFTQSTSTQNENRPVTFTYDNIADWQPSPRVFDGEASLEVLRWSGSNRQYRVVVNSTSVILEPTANYLGWQSIATNTDNNNETRLDYIDSDLIAGRIAYQLEPGNYIINTKFTQQTPARYIGNSIFIITIAFVIVLSIQHLNSRSRHVK